MGIAVHRPVYKVTESHGPLDTVVLGNEVGKHSSSSLPLCSTDSGRVGLRGELADSPMALTRCWLNASTPCRASPGLPYELPQPASAQWICFWDDLPKYKTSSRSRTPQSRPLARSGLRSQPVTRPWRG